MPAARRRAPMSPPPRAGLRPRLEALEDRSVPSTYTATSVRDLIADLNAVNLAGGTHTIILAPGKAFSLKTANNTTHGPTGLPVIGATKPVDLTIIGNGDTIQRTAGFGHNRRGEPTNPFRLFAVAPGASLTLQDVTMQGGWAAGPGAAGAGGAVYNQGTLTLGTGSILSGNRAYHFGGGIHNAGGTVTVIDASVSGNSAGAGGGIYTAGGTVAVGGTTLSANTGSAIANNGGAVTVTNSTLSGNSAGAGAGIRNLGAGTVTVSGSTLSGNFATHGGGGIYNDSLSAVTVSNCVLSDNTARYGGGIYNYGGTLTVRDGSTLSGNSAYHADYPWSLGDGGGIYNWGGTVTIDGSVVSGNTGDPMLGSGGGVFNRDGGIVTVRNYSRITGNNASAAGADVSNFAVLYLDATSTIGVLDGNPAILI